MFRSLLAYFAMEYNEPILYFTIIVGVTFWILYLFNLRQNADESSSMGKRTWWNDKRPYHGTLYLVFAYLYYSGYTRAYLVLVIDVVIGLLFWMNKK